MRDHWHEHLSRARRPDCRGLGERRYAGHGHSARHGEHGGRIVTAELPQADTDLEQLAAEAVAGDRIALDRLVEALQDGVYNLALRMLAHPQDAEDATQEILVKVMASLGTFRKESSLRTWVWRIAANHLLTTRRSRREAEALTFEALEQMLAAGLAADMPSPQRPDEALLEEEVKLGCTQAALTCLDRDHRLTFILADILELTGAEGAAALDIEPAAFRKRLSRARERLRDFMQRNCGLVNDDAPCRCRKQIGPCLHMSTIDPARLLYASQRRASSDRPEVRQQLDAIESVHRSVVVYREQPAFGASEALSERLKRLLDASP
ncbi:MAG: sigma-70 family RNA polymerase sigma factor [Rhodospirillales bacterium]|nr:sigma-70 family RNA polymerase sigma factor [Rhodospirillales bacterium]